MVAFAIGAGLVAWQRPHGQPSEVCWHALLGGTGRRGFLRSHGRGRLCVTETDVTWVPEHGNGWTWPIATIDAGWSVVNFTVADLITPDGHRWKLAVSRRGPVSRFSNGTGGDAHALVALIQHRRPDAP